MKLFTELFEKIDNLYEKINRIQLIAERWYSARDVINFQNVIEQQNKVINDLINNIYSKDTSLEVVMIKPYRGKPILYKDGKRLDNDTMINFCIDWNFDSKVEVTIRNE